MTIASPLLLRRCRLAFKFSESASEQPATGVEQGLLRLGRIEPHAVGEGKHGVGTDNHAKRVGYTGLLRAPPRTSD